MSSIPNAKMKHAHAHEGDHPDEAHQHGTTTKKADQPKPDKAKPDRKLGARIAEQAKSLGDRAEDLAEEAVDAVKARPKTAAAIGAAIVAGAAALIGGPAAARALKGDDKKPAPKAKRKTAAAAKPAKKG